MAMNHQISSNVHDRYHGVVKAKELRSQKQHGHGGMSAGSGEDAGRPEPRARNGVDMDFKPVSGDIKSHHPHGKTEDSGHRYDKIGKHDTNRNFDKSDFTKKELHRRDLEPLRLKLKPGSPGIRGGFHGASQSFQFTQITITHSAVFSGAHLGSNEKVSEAHQNFLKAALNFIEKPSGQAYKSLNDAMMKLMDPKFVPAVVGGAAQVKIRDVNGSTMAKFTMEVTPAPTKSLEEAREDLQNAYSSKRNGEKDIAGIRKEAYENYIRALSEKFKKEGVISHTNNTPTTPVFKSTVIYVARVTQVNVSGFHELKKPDFKHNLHGRLSFKDHRGSWNDYRQNNKSYVDMLKHDSRKSHIDKNFESRKAIEAKHGSHNSGYGKAAETGHKHHSKVRSDKAS